MQTSTLEVDYGLPGKDVNPGINLRVEVCCSDYNHPPKFFLSFVLEPPYQPSLVECLTLSST